MGEYTCSMCGEDHETREALKSHKQSSACGARWRGDYEPDHEQVSESTGDDGSTEADAADGETRVTGWVRNYKPDKGFGFVRTLDLEALGDRDITDAFFHISQLEAETVEEGDRIEFAVTENDDGFECEAPTVVDTDGSNDPVHPSRRNGSYQDRDLGFGQQG